MKAITSPLNRLSRLTWVDWYCIKSYVHVPDFISALKVHNDTTLHLKYPFSAPLIYKAMDLPFNVLPLYLNDENDLIIKLCKYRLEVGR